MDRATRDSLRPKLPEAEETLLGDDGDDGDVDDLGLPLARGSIVGRFVIIQKLGSGAMGVVFSAYDPDLDRKVAVKLLKPRGSKRKRDRSRLQREAQAMAKLTHPNVVTIYDVGVHEERVFLAMEHVEGRSLAKWVRDEGPGWRELVGVFTQAGRGLAAAHDQGLVHRDFKPENAMVDGQGRVKVMDFGLARSEGVEVMDISISAVRDLQQDALSTPLTRTGAVMGTPAYMSPEQFMGAPADARSDQFSFCVTLYESLYNARPFNGTSFAEIGLAVASEDVQPAPRSNQVPGWLRRVVLKGLEKDPADRWGSMALLLAAVDQGSRTRPWMALLGVVSLAGALGIYATSRPEAPPTPCQGFETQLEGVWDREAKERVSLSLSATSLPYAVTTAKAVVADIDRYTESWVAHGQLICEATRVRGGQSEALMDRRMACMDRRLVEVRMLVGVLAQADATVVDNAVEAAADLRGFEGCDDMQALGPDPLASPEYADAAQALEADLARMVALENAGKYEAALALAISAVEMTQSTPELGSRMAAKALLQLGRLKNALAKHVEARSETERCYYEALRSGDLDLAAQAAVDLVKIVGFELVDAEAGEHWARHARALIPNYGDDLLLAELEEALALVDHRAERMAASIPHAQAALRLREGRLGPDHHLVAQSLSTLARGYDQHDPRHAQELLQRSLRILENKLGSQHPRLTGTLNGLGIAAANQARFEEALMYYERAIAIRSTADGPRHASLGIYHNNIGELWADQHNWEKSVAHFRLAYEIRIERLGELHAATIYSLEMWGTHAVKLGQVEVGLEMLERSLSQRISTGQGERRVASAWVALGMALFDSEHSKPEDRRRGRALVDRAWHAYHGVEGLHPGIKTLGQWYTAQALVPPQALGEG